MFSQLFPTLSVPFLNKGVKITDWFFPHDNLDKRILFQLLQGLGYLTICIIQIFSDRWSVISIYQESDC